MSPNRSLAWHERRLTGFGASEAPQLLGVSRYGTARRVVEEKARGIINDPDAPERLRLRLGRELEPVLAEHALELAIERGLVQSTASRLARFRRSSRLYRRPGTDSFVITNVDGFVGDALVELKTDAFGYEAWGDEHGEPARNVPPAYYAQVQHALAATGRRRALLFVLIGLNERRLYEVPLDEDFVADLLELERPLWAAVEAARSRLAHEPDASIDDLLPPYQTADERIAGVRKRHASDDGLVLPATAEQESLIATLRLMRRAHAERAVLVEELESRVIEAIGAAAGLSSSQGTVTYKRSADSELVNWQAVASAYRQWLDALVEAGAGDLPAELRLVAIDDFLRVAKLTPASLDAIVGLHSTTRPGSRRLVVPRSWSKPGAVD